MDNDIFEPTKTESPPETKVPAAQHSGWPFLWGGLYGLSMRLVFHGNGNSPLATMGAAFAVLVPIVVGAMTVYSAERKGRQSFAYYFFAPWVSVGMMLVGAAALLIEGSICIAMASPLFLLLGSFGGVVMGVVCRTNVDSRNTMRSLVVLPFAIALLDGGKLQSHATAQAERSVHIDAAPSVVWRQIACTGAIRPGEVGAGVAYRIGVPYPLEGCLQSAGVGAIRKSRWQRGVAFDEVITQWQPGQRMAWRYAFDAHSFPAGSMDEHVMIGGEYFQLGETVFDLEPEAGGTRLTASLDYGVNTEFNWYAAPLARYLVGDTASTILGFYQSRSEAVDKEQAVARNTRR